MSDILSTRVVKVSVTTKDGSVIPFIHKNDFKDSRNGYSGIRIDFNVMRMVNNSINSGYGTAQIKLYNLNDNTYKVLVDQKNTVSLEAGYLDNYNQIFLGNVASVYRAKVNADIITTLYCNVVFAINNFISVSYNTITLNELLKDLISKAGCTSDISNFGDIKVVDRSYTGSLKEILNNLAVTYNFTWEKVATEKDKIKITKQNDYTRSNIFVFDSSSGLLKTPTITEKGVNIEILLQPNISPSDIFELKTNFASFNLGALEFVDRLASGKFKDNVRSNSIDAALEGKYSVLTISHDGSTHSNEWKSSIEGLYTNG